MHTFAIPNGNNHSSKGSKKFLKLCGNSSVGRAQPCQGWGREFEPRFPLHKPQSNSGAFLFSDSVGKFPIHTPLNGDSNREQLKK